MAYVEGFIILCFQVILFLFFLLFGKYEVKYKLEQYPMFQDIHGMVFVGFGFLMTFLKRYSFSAIGFNFLLGAIIVQWAIICQGFYKLTEDIKIPVNADSLTEADIATCTILISMGAVLGCTTYLQLVIMGIIEVMVYSWNCYLGSSILVTSDAGGSVSVHCFGAYFGLGVSYSLRQKQVPGDKLEESRYTSDIFSMIGTIFLWIYWPSFNAVDLPVDQQYIAIINTYLSLASCCVTTFIISPFFTPERKINIMHIQNSTLAGGVAIGAAANLLVQPCGAVATGSLAAILSVYGYSKITPWLNLRWKIHDTCGVNNLHGLPGILGGLIAAFMASIATEEEYHERLYIIFLARVSDGNLNSTSGDRKLALHRGRNAAEQAGYQLIFLLVSVLIATVSGVITGFILNLEQLNLRSDQFYNDTVFWKMNEDIIISKSTINVRQKLQTEKLRLNPILEKY